MPKIRHTHRRRFALKPAELAPLIETMWTGGPRDAFPLDHIKPRRRDPAGAAGWTPGDSQFGHGPFQFLVERWNGRVFQARILTPGFDGWHGFHLIADGDGTILEHDLQADAAFAPWLVWRAAVGVAHDWAVQAMFERLEHILATGRAPEHTARPRPLRMRLFGKVRRRRASAPGEERRGVTA